MAGLADVRVRFTPGAPFLPFQQLLAVLPAASCRLLPKPFEARPAPSKPHRKIPCSTLCLSLHSARRRPAAHGAAAVQAFLRVAASGRAAARAAQALMKNGDSPIRDFYPLDFRVDCEGKRAEWEGVVLVRRAGPAKHCMRRALTG